PQARRRGIATRMMAAAEAISRERGVSTIRLEVSTRNFAAIELYRGLGYRTDGVLYGYYSWGEDAYSMGKNVPVEFPSRPPRGAKHRVRLFRAAGRHQARAQEGPADGRHHALRPRPATGRGRRDGLGRHRIRIPGRRLRRLCRGRPHARHEELPPRGHGVEDGRDGQIAGYQVPTNRLPHRRTEHSHGSLRRLPCRARVPRVTNVRRHRLPSMQTGQGRGPETEDDDLRVWI